MIADTLALDLSSTTIGWASAYGDAIVTGEEKFKGNLDRRLGAFLVWLRPRMPKTVLVLEAAHARYPDAARALYGVEGICRGLASSLGVEVVRIQPSTTKKHATGSGRATKAEMRAWAGGKGEHESDALALLRCWQTRDFSVPVRKKRKKRKEAAK